MDTSQTLEQLADFKIFNGLSDEELIYINSSVLHHKIKKNSFIFSEGEASNSIFLLLDGTVKVGSTSDQGKEVIKFVMHPYSVLGELGLTQEYREGFAKSIDKTCEVFELKSKYIFKLIEMNPKFAFNLINLLGQKIRVSERRLESLVFQDARSRIVGFIRENANSHGLRIGFETLLKHNFTQQDIANFTGTSRQTVTTVLNELKRTNQIYFKRNSMLIRDMASLT